MKGNGSENFFEKIFLNNWKLFKKRLVNCYNSSLFSFTYLFRNPKWDTLQNFVDKQKELIRVQNVSYLLKKSQNFKSLVLFRSRRPKLTWPEAVPIFSPLSPACHPDRWTLQARPIETRLLKTSFQYFASTRKVRPGQVAIRWETFSYCRDSWRSGCVRTVRGCLAGPVPASPMWVLKTLCTQNPWKRLLIRKFSIISFKANHITFELIVKSQQNQVGPHLKL